jgi:hypothetical protein
VSVGHEFLLSSMFVDEHNAAAKVAIRIHGAGEADTCLAPNLFFVSRCDADEAYNILLEACSYKVLAEVIVDSGDDLW